MKDSRRVSSIRLPRHARSPVRSVLVPFVAMPFAPFVASSTLLLRRHTQSGDVWLDFLTADERLLQSWMSLRFPLSFNKS